MAFDYKKEYKEFYLPKKQPCLVTVPVMNFIAVRGRGNPNEEDGAYKQSIGLLYGIAFTIKMSKMGDHRIEGYFDYVVPPLEGLWWTDEPGFDGTAPADKSRFRWTSLIRQPDFVTEEVFSWAKERLLKKKPALDLKKARFLRWREGVCAHVVHAGPYDDEPGTLDKLEAFAAEAGYRPDHSEVRRHHEIYLSNPKRTAAARLKTLLRMPVARD